MKTKILVQLQGGTDRGWEISGSHSPSLAEKVSFKARCPLLFVTISVLFYSWNACKGCVWVRLQQGAKSQELYLACPLGWQKSNYLSHHMLRSSVGISRELERRTKAQFAPRTSHMELLDQTPILKLRCLKHLFSLTFLIHLILCLNSVTVRSHHDIESHIKPVYARKNHMTKIEFELRRQ